MLKFGVTKHEEQPGGMTPCRHIDFIECFTTTFLRAHSWLNWVDDENEVGLKEKPEDTSKRLHRNKTRSTGSVDKVLN